MLTGYLKGFLTEARRRFAAGLFIAGALPLLAVSCGSHDSFPVSEAQKAAEYFSRTFSSFIPDGYKVVPDEESLRESDGIYAGNFVFEPVRPGGEQIPDIPFLLSHDGKWLVLGAKSSFAPADFEDSPLPGFKSVPESLRAFPLFLVSDKGRVIAAERVLDTSLDYDKINREKISLKDVPLRGDKDAAVTIVEYSDFQCSYCRRAMPVTKELLDEYRGRIRLAYKQLPLSFHKWAYPASEASLCVYKMAGNEAFWSFHDAVFAAQQTITEENHRESFAQIAASAGLDADGIISCMDSGDMKGLVERDIAEARSLNVGGTPTFFVDGMRVPNDPRLLRKAVRMKISSSQKGNPE